MKFLVDNQLPLALAAHLRDCGHDCQHVLDLNLHESTDLELWNQCLIDDRVLISKDEDFIFLANRIGDKGRLVWVRLGNCRNVALLAAFNRVRDAIVAALASGQRIVEVR